MVICKFFQQGYCRFGDRCWNEHVSARNDYRYSKTYNQYPSNQNSSQGFSFKNTLTSTQQYQQSQLQQQQQHQQQKSSGFSFQQALSSLNKPNQVSNFTLFSTQQTSSTNQPGSFSFRNALQNANQQQNTFQAAQFSQQQQQLQQQQNAINFQMHLQQQQQQSPQHAQYNQQSFINQTFDDIEMFGNIAENKLNQSSIILGTNEMNHSLQKQQPQLQNYHQPELKEKNIEQAHQRELDADVNDNYIYTPEDLLTKENQLAYTQAKFTLGQIPIDPPSRSLCA